MTYKLIGRFWLDKCPKCGNPKREIIADGNDYETVIIGCPNCRRMSREKLYKKFIGEEKEE